MLIVIILIVPLLLDGEGYNKIPSFSEKFENIPPKPIIVKKEISDDSIDNIRLNIDQQKNVIGNNKKQKITVIKKDFGKDFSDLSSYALQVASYSGEDSANQFVKHLQKNKFRAYIDQKKIDNRMVYRVKIGPIKTTDEADKIKKRYKKIYNKKSIIVDY